MADQFQLFCTCPIRTLPPDYEKVRKVCEKKFHQTPTNTHSPVTPPTLTSHSPPLTSHSPPLTSHSQVTYKSLTSHLQVTYMSLTCHSPPLTSHLHVTHMSLQLFAGGHAVSTTEKRGGSQTQAMDRGRHGRSSGPA